MFPRHVLEYMVRDGGSLNAAVNSPAASKLARTHKGVTLMFMDIIGEGIRAGGGRPSREE